MRILTGILLSAAAFAADFTIDPAHSAAGFTAKHMMVTNVRGQFAITSGKISFDPKNLAAAKVEAVIDAASVDTQQAKRDAHLKSADFFDVAKFPTLNFRSTKWYRQNGKLKIAGDLTIHGVTKPVVLDVEGQAAELKSIDGVSIIGASATTKVSRKEYGLQWNKLMETGGAVVGDEIAITLDIEAKK